MSFLLRQILDNLLELYVFTLKFLYSTFQVEVFPALLHHVFTQAVNDFALLFIQFFHRIDPRYKVIVLHDASLGLGLAGLGLSLFEFRFKIHNASQDTEKSTTKGADE